MYMGQSDNMKMQCDSKRRPTSKSKRKRIMRIRTPGQAGLMIWLQQAMPDVYYKIKTKQPALLNVSSSRRARPSKRAQEYEAGFDYEGYNYDTGDYQLDGLAAADTATKPVEKAWYEKLLDLSGPLLQTYQQKKILDLQLERARNNLPPLDTDALATKVKVEIDASSAITGALSKMAVPISIGVAAIFILPKLIGR